jgi:hypothetical protein
MLALSKSTCSNWNLFLLLDVKCLRRNSAAERLTSSEKWMAENVTDYGTLYLRRSTVTRAKVYVATPITGFESTSDNAKNYR